MLSYFCFCVCLRPQMLYNKKSLHPNKLFTIIHSFTNSHNAMTNHQCILRNVYRFYGIEYHLKFTISLVCIKLFWGVFLSCLYQLNQSKITENKQNSIKKMKIKKLYTEFVRFYRLQSYTTTTGCPFFSYYFLLRFSMDVYVSMYAYGYVRLYA